MTIRNPIEWSLDQLRQSALAMGAWGRALNHVQERFNSPAPTVRRIRVADLGEALTKGVEDFGACRADVVFLCVIYPIAGLILGRLAFGQNMVPLLFPLVSGFALIGPLAAVGLYELSRRRERGLEPGWADAFKVVHAPSFGAIVLLGVLLMIIFVLWLLAALTIYRLTLGPAAPASLLQFAHDVFATGKGWVMIGVGIGVGFVFALVVLLIGAVSFPLLLDRDVGLDTAIRTSIRVVAVNPGPMALWGLIVAGSLVLGSIPLLLGLILVLPILGHATWHLYRRTVAA